MEIIIEENVEELYEKLVCDSADDCYGECLNQRCKCLRDDGC